MPTPSKPNLTSKPHLTMPGLTLATLVFAPLAALLLVGLAVLHSPDLFFNPLYTRGGDVWLYYTSALHLRQGQMPFRDFPLEYPPLSLVSFFLPQALAPLHALTFSAYSIGFLLENAFFAAIAALTLQQIAAHSYSPGWTKRTGQVFLLLTIVLSPILPWRYDLFPALLTLFSLRAVQTHRPGWGGVFVGLGIAAKLYPIVLLPVYLLFYFVQARRREAVRLLGGAVLAVTLSFLPLLRVPPLALLSFVKYHQMRGLEIGSLGAGLITTARVFGLAHAGIVFNYGAFHLVSPAAEPVLKALPVVFAACLGGVLWRTRTDFARVSASRQVIPLPLLVRFLAAALLAFILTNKVFSPQYLIWLLPFAPLLPRRERDLFAAATVLTITIFPMLFNSQLSLDAFGALLLDTRNLLLLWLLICLLRPAKPAPVAPFDATLQEELPALPALSR